MAQSQPDLLSPSAADKLLSAHDGDVALLYIYILRTGCRDTERAAGELCRTLSEITAAEEKLRRMGLLDGKTEKPPVFDEGLPQYSAADLSRHEKDPVFAAVLEEAKRVMGKPLSSNDMRVLYGIYDYYGLPGDVIFTLLNYCRDCCIRLYGEARRPTARLIERESARWVNRGVVTMEAAEEYIQRENRRHEKAEEYRVLLHIPHELTATERKYVEEWAGMGFEDEAVALAYDRTVVKTGSLRWAYMDKILKSWQEKKLFTVGDIEQKDTRGGNRPAASGADRPISMTELNDLFDKI